MKEEEHIIDYILKVTCKRYENRVGKRIISKKNYEKRKKKIDNSIFYCEKCKQCWSMVTKYIDSSGFRKYPNGHIPSIGKMRKKCVYCAKKKGEVNGKPRIV